MKIEEKYVQTGQVKTHYWEAGDGKPLILLHGGGAGADAFGNWSKTISLYAEQGYRTFAIDAVGFGKTDKPTPDHFQYSQQARVDQLHSFIDALQLEKPSCVGNSMGGLTTLGLAIEQPEKIDKMVLMGAGKPKANSSGFRSLLTYTIGKDFMYNIVRNLTNEEFEVDEEMVNYRLELTKIPGALDAYVATMEGIMEIQFDPESLKKIKHKTLLVHGVLDKMVPVEVSFDLVQTLNNAWLYVIPHCGHWAMLEYPEEFARVTLDFLKQS